MNLSQIEKIITKIYNNFRISETPEITFEANPNDLSPGYLKGLRQLKINRLSIGIQSIYPEILELMKRKHDVETAINSVLLSHKYGFDNISIDMIYGIHGLSTSKWRDSLLKVLSLPVTHLSAYHLSIEKNTLLYRKLKQNKIKNIDENESLNQYLALIEISGLNGFEQYEISNFAKKGMISRHNSAYWNRTEYMGLGPSAHSYHNGIRSWNLNDVQKYLEKINTGKSLLFETEELSQNDLLNEYIMLGLRTTEGLNLEKIEELFGKNKADKIKNSMKGINSDFFELNDKRLNLTYKGMFISDNIIEKLFE